MLRIARRSLLTGLPAGALLFSGGCLATVQQGLDFVLAPEALGNALRLPYSAVYPLVSTFAELFRG